MAIPDAVAQLQDELDRVTSETVRLLVQPDYDEDELLRLDGRARDLCQRLRAAVRPAMPRKHVAIVRRSSCGLISGG